MIWRIDFSNQADKFLKIQQIKKEDIFGLVSKAIRKFQGEDINVDIKKLTGKWFDFYRIRSGKLRIIVEFDFNNFVAFIAKIDWRGRAYQ